MDLTRGDKCHCTNKRHTPVIKLHSLQTNVARNAGLGWDMYHANVAFFSTQFCNLLPTCSNIFFLLWLVLKTESQKIITSPVSWYKVPVWEEVMKLQLNKSGIWQGNLFLLETWWLRDRVTCISLQTEWKETPRCLCDAFRVLLLCALILDVLKCLSFWRVLSSIVQCQ